MAEVIISKKEISDRDTIDNGDKKLIDQDNFKLLMKWVNNSSQMKRIEDIITFSQTYQEKIAELRLPIKKLENIASNFFKEAKKKIIIADDGEIVVPR